jgi:hypothetical protein
MQQVEKRCHHLSGSSRTKLSWSWKERLELELKTYSTNIVSHCLKICCRKINIWNNNNGLIKCLPNSKSPNFTNSFIRCPFFVWEQNIFWSSLQYFKLCKYCVAHQQLTNKQVICKFFAAQGLTVHARNCNAML